MKKYNFSAGPAILPAPVLEKSAQAVSNWNDSGLSLLEISHRSKPFVEVLNKAESLATELLGVPEGYKVLFLTGGASSQFFMSAMNLLNPEDLAVYIDTGAWSTKAIKEAKLFGQIEVLASSKDTNYNYIPKTYDVPQNAKYLHYTSNNTIFGTQFKEEPSSNCPLISDMSSDIFSRPVDVSRHGMIYAGAQKNMGPAGTTLVIIREDLLGKVSRTIPTMLNYQTHIAKDSSFNTPPVFPIFVSMLTMEWVKENGGVEKMATINEQKAAVVYDEIDRNPLFKGTAAKEDRSLMNATFVLENESLGEKFMEDATAAGCVGLKGHRSVGGFRASIYNAMTMEGVETLRDVMKAFEQKHA
ncbi:MAG: 3-phosphoserine/phosphohydroxythreonine transaminase [Saprospiraceae bacterium]|nr:3-phosphoserine/phosphohydroxythreonine transaminase [Saprospiraceae bacterium]